MRMGGFILKCLAGIVVLHLHSDSVELNNSNANGLSDHRLILPSDNLFDHRLTVSSLLLFII